MSNRPISRRSFLRQVNCAAVGTAAVLNTVLNLRLAEALADDYRVICPDVIGRGLSDWLDDPAGYGIPTYAQHMLELKQIRALPKFDVFLNPKFSNEIAS